MSRGNSADKTSGQIPESQVNEIKIKQLQYEVEILKNKLKKIRSLIEEVDPNFKVISGLEENLVHSVCEQLKYLREKL